MARKNKTPQVIPGITVTSLAAEGFGTAEAEGRELRIWNALPGETVDLAVTKRKRNLREGTADNIRHTSPQRVQPVCGHYLSCSPLQILAYAEENRLKREHGRSLFRGIADNRTLDAADMFAPEEPFGYRNKMEYSFFWKDDGTLSFSFFKRGTKYRVPVQVCRLADPAINAAAEHILAWLNRERPPMRSLKSLVLRSAGNGVVLAALFIREELAFGTYPGPEHGLAGFRIYYSDPRSPASRPDRLLYNDGAEELTDTVQGTALQYGINSFFQVNVPMFEQALVKIRAALKPDRDLIDYYAGVGAVSLPLVGSYRRARLVDVSDDCIAWARRNIRENNRRECVAEAVPAEEMTEIITGEETVMLDPPRAGIHDKVIARLLEKRPPRVIYLSCNPKTQAQNVRELLPGYQVASLDFYNFFPRTPHLESLCILDRRNGAD